MCVSRLTDLNPFICVLTCVCVSILLLCLRLSFSPFHLQSTSLSFITISSLSLFLTPCFLSEFTPKGSQFSVGHFVSLLIHRGLCCFMLINSAHGESFAWIPPDLFFIVVLFFVQLPYFSYKLSSDVFRGSITCLGYLPLNRLLLIGSDTGNIVLCS